MSETTEALIERVLGEHEWEYPDSFCKCGAWMSLGTPWRAHVAAAIAEALAERAKCPTCGPTRTEQHPRRANVTRCSNCKEWLTATEETR